MDRGQRGRGRASNKARRSQVSPSATSYNSNNIDNLEFSPFTTPNSFPPQRHQAQPHPYAGIMLASNSPHYEPATPLRGLSPSSHLRQAFSFDTPNTLNSSSASVSAGVSTRKRSRASAMGYDGAADEVPAEKGGHTLRKRSRIDYTQLEDAVDDDLLASEQLKSDASKKPAPTSTSSARRRRATHSLGLSGDDSDEGSVTQRRRRVDKTPSGPRPTSSRRKASSKQPAAMADSRPSTVHPSSDNEVQDTILVGGAMEESSSDPQSSPELKRVTPPTASSEHPANNHDLYQTTAVASESQEPTVEGTSSPTPASNNQTLVDDESLRRPSVSSMKLEPVQDHDSHSADSHAALPTTEDNNDEEVETQLREESAQAIKQDHEDREDTPHKEKLISDIPAIDSGATQDGQKQSLIPKTDDEQQLETSTSSTPPESSEPQVPQPRRIPAIDKVYQRAQQEMYREPLVPYEDEDVVLPASWVEQVVPREKVENGIATPAPTVTPQASPPPKDEPVYFSDIWDPVQPLTTKKFFSLYQADAARRRRDNQPRISMMAFRDACARRHKEALRRPAPEPVVAKKAAKSRAKAKGKGKRGQSPSSSLEADSPAVPEAQPSETAAAPVDETPRGSPVPDSQPPTAAPSPEPDVDPELENPVDIDQDVDADVAGAEIENGPAEPEFVTKHPKKQYLFKKLKVTTTMEEVLENPEEHDDKTLYAMLESAAKALKAYEDEYRELKKITDDEDNAKRRAQNDKAIENWDARQKLDEPPVWRRTFDDIVQKIPAPFDVKGVRAPKPYVDDPEQEHQRQEDKIMAQAYGFDHKADKASIGMQDPIAQRWETAEGRLRDRRQTQKAADAAEEGVIVEGKRTRKPRILDDHSAPGSRATTPVPAPRRRERKTAVAAGSDDAQPGAKEATPEPVPKKRGPRAKAKASVQEDVPPPDVNQNGITEEFLLPEKPKVTRKRGRAAAPHPLATTTYAEPEEDMPVKQEPQPPAKRQRKSKEATNNGTEIPAGSFYSQPTTSSQRRPSTSSSNGTANTVATVESSYSLRDKKKRNFAVENDPAAEPRPKRAKPNPPPPVEEKKSEEPPKKKRVRVRTKKPAAVVDENSAPSTPQFPPSGPASPAIAPAGMMHTFSAHPDPVPNPPARKMLKIKVVGHNGLAAAAAAAAAAPPAVPSPAAQSPAQTPPTPADQSMSQPASRPPSRGGSRKPSPTSRGGSRKPSLEPAEQKAYNEMSKSEKMSWSMKQRWQRGEMQSAVEKRKNTLARKAEAKAAAPPPDLTPKPLQPASGPPTLSPAGVPLGVPAGVPSQPQQHHHVFHEQQYLPPPPPPGHPMM
ncbi:hypothetical protein GE09DRAFT_1091207 [Coniochaeta sp. 2T2.1]|nr:hypothetical protein GE09DRAFT_1091207 [Coniochaeta sp. 2T2.1]